MPFWQKNKKQDKHKINKNQISIKSPITGEVISITEVNDPAFSEKMLGDGVAIHPVNGRVVAPVNGIVTQMFDTFHAMTITSDDGVEILIHVGIDTVRLKGEHFTPHVKTGDKIAIGDLLIEFDMDSIAKEYETVTPIVVCNSDDYFSFKIITGKDKSEGDDIILLEKGK